MFPAAISPEPDLHCFGSSPYQLKEGGKGYIGPDLDQHFQDREPELDRNLPEVQQANNAAESHTTVDQAVLTADDTSIRPCYLLPLRWKGHRSELADLTDYLRRLSAQCDVLIVDGSPSPVFATHHCYWAAFTRHISPAPDLRYRNGKVNGVVTGMRATKAECVIIADDDVRYDDASLARTISLLAKADIVVPQNYFDPLPWHAAWDSARILLNRAAGMDYPGTLAVRRTAFMAAGCYNGDVLFENLELMRTLRADGARLVNAPDVYVQRLPPDFQHFAGQRVRQAYDSLAQPPRLVAELALLPAVLLAIVMRHSWSLVGAAVIVVALADMGRRRQAGTAVFPCYLPLLAPLWLCERAVCSWLALGSLLRGGVCYHGERLLHAATSDKDLHRRAATLGIEKTNSRPV
jgi:hypothetical protein